MKKLLIGLIFLSTLTAHAGCNIRLYEDDTPDGHDFKELVRNIEDKGYKVHEDGELFFRVPSFECRGVDEHNFCINSKTTLTIDGLYEAGKRSDFVGKDRAWVYSSYPNQTYDISMAEALNKIPRCD